MQEEKEILYCILLDSACKMLQERGVDLSINPALKEWFELYSAQEQNRKDKERVEKELNRLRTEKVLSLQDKKYQDLTPEELKFLSENYGV